MKKNIIKIIGFLSLALSLNVNSTEQESDFLKYNGKTYNILMKFQKSPLEEYLTSNYNHLKKSFATMNSRGFVGTYSIIDDYIYVTEITVHHYDKENDKIVHKSIINKVSPDQNIIKMIWYTGYIEIAMKNKTEQLSLSESRYIFEPKEYLIFNIKNGQVLNIEQITYEEYTKRRQETNSI